MMTALEPADFDAAAKLSQQAFAHAPGQQWTEAALHDFTQNPHCIALCVRRGGACRGYVLVRRAGPEAELLSIAVDIAAQGQGLGAQLLEAALARAAQAGAEEMLLEVAADNAPAAALYEKMGFRPVGRRANYYKNLSNQWVDAMVLRRALI